MKINYFHIEKLMFLSFENDRKSMKNTAGRALGAPELRKIVLGGSWRALRVCPEVPRRAQRDKKGALVTPKNAPGTPT